MTLLVMSKKELNRVEALQRVAEGRMRVTAAAALMGLSRRQTTRLLKAYRDDGAAELISKKRGKPSNRRYSDGFRDYVLEIIRANYHDSAPHWSLRSSPSAMRSACQRRPREVG